MRAHRRRHAPALAAEALAITAALRVPVLSATELRELDATTLAEVVRRAQAARTALERLATLIPSQALADDAAGAAAADEQPAEAVEVADRTPREPQQQQEKPAAEHQGEPAAAEPAPAAVTEELVTHTPAPLAPLPVEAPAVVREVAGMRPTAEQAAIIDACASGVDLVVEAGAGTGKTTTLRMAATLMKGRGLYIAYNRSIAQDAKKVFPPHVQCSTAHSLAYRSHGHQHKDRLRRRVPAQRTAELLRIVEPLRVNADLVLAPAALAQLAADTVDAFAHSADQEVTSRHIPALDVVDRADMDALRREILPHARRLWRETQDPGSQHRYTHDYYLKAWAMTRPNLRTDFVLLDEAQDSNPVVADLVQSQSAQRIAVGDSAQAIYGWRGAVDALATWPAERRLYLQQSWRFGQDIADEANRWLTQIGAPIRLHGNPGMKSRVLAGSCGDHADAVLCRTNAEAMARAMSVLADGRRPALVGGTKQIRELAEAALNLRQGRPTSHPELLAFQTWDQLRQYVRNENSGSDLRVFVRLIDDYGPEAVIKAANALVEETAADVIISTAHKAKGREWPTVLIASDFTEPKRQETGAPGPIRKDEAMLSYVAVTRARLTLDNEGLAWINEYGRL
ncbi:UvrD-helicase domain-containing protein [Kitasatospora sp. NBC_01302]|uniref:UvrD-helicase domain-containing protein n=1 Tax=Kitasatospora sp. NBC_01302 TaxID=2903575 RepID=UPI002E149DA5|nr:UvrD-helicase domain-containing protein [Kitasatospora sp. NBC_01302]